ncbi:hypothetical protein BKH41_02320 [Helicobacter sp. 12S02232-10]|uniref:alpha/beta fold hydrolase n=1 Tax=Helicobacter sp. 12S02232-10 TaxID=1476197 RepID=UPI000BA713A9|nr:alpha/beta fold hydrolase [Helicobacter sp. 12S02232-10]PAF49519.1 hypothetical protein BKH41_02320 [Helicobacter sp. 12S02232-10]
MKTIKNLTFKSDFGCIAYDKYIPDTPKGVVIQIAHGMIEHKERYEWLCKSFAQAGYHVFINDHRGHGESILGEVTWGEMGQNGFEKAVKDMLDLRMIISKELPSYKLVLLGHSMGSLLSRRFLQLYEDKIDALILSGTPTPNPFLGFGVVLFRIMDKLGVRSSPKIGDLFSFNAKFKALYKNKNNPLKNYWSCSDENVVKAYLEDPKCRFRFTLNSFANLFEGMKKVFSPYPHKPAKPELPILFISGSEDVCGNFGKGVQKAYNHLLSQGYNNTSLKIFQDARHEIFNEPLKMEYLDFTFQWLKDKNL